MTIRLIAGDCREVLATLPAESVHCVVTSPPYYGLRDYGTAQWEGGDAGCDHAAKQPKRGKAEYTNGQGGSFSSNLQAWGDRDVSTVYRDICGKCGARRIDRQIGLEATPDEYLATMVEVFQEVRRVLRKDGTVWCNMGDAYASSANGRSAADTKAAGNDDRTFRDKPFSTVGSGYKPKDLMMMPARLALALQADGWWIRSDIIWIKPNPMPESTTDRPTSAHEHVFLLTRSARYFYDADAVREAQSEGTYERFGKNSERSINTPKATTPGQGIKNNSSMDAALKDMVLPNGRNLRNVWTIATAPYSEAHFATFPPALAERCIKAGTSERGVCAQCGAPWVRQQTRTAPDGRSVTVPANQRHATMDGVPLMGDNRIDIGNRGSFTAARGLVQTTDAGWSPSCIHEAAVVPATVLDPFAGAGTTLLVADRLQRDAIGIELNPDYTKMAMERCRADAPLFADFAQVTE